MLNNRWTGAGIAYEKRERRPQAPSKFVGIEPPHALAFAFSFFGSE